MGPPVLPLLTLDRVVRNVFIECGPTDLLRSIRVPQVIDKCGVLVSVPLESHHMEALDSRLTVWAHGQMRCVLPGAIGASRHGAYEPALARILADSRTHYLAERSLGNFLWRSTFNHTAKVEVMVANAVYMLSETEASILVMASVPHSIYTWVLYQVAKAFGLPTYIVESTPLLWRSWVYDGVDARKVVRLPAYGAKARDELSREARRFVESQSAASGNAGGGAGVSGERINLDIYANAYGGQWWSWREEFRSWFPIRRDVMLRVTSTFQKRALLRSYQSLSCSRLPSKPFIVFFLHYQPERSSLPAGGQYVQQWVAVRHLSERLPSGWTLVVREHPTTWWRPLAPGVRAPDFFRSLAQLKNVILGSMNMGTYDLIDAAEAVATLTGKVGMQAICRGKPVLAFGEADYLDFPGCLRVSSLEELDAGLRLLVSGAIRNAAGRQEVLNYLSWVEGCSVGFPQLMNDRIGARRQGERVLIEDLMASGETPLQRESYSMSSGCEGDTERVRCDE